MGFDWVEHRGTPLTDPERNGFRDFASQNPRTATLAGTMRLIAEIDRLKVLLAEAKGRSLPV
jgi:hypothetical protein